MTINEIAQKLKTIKSALIFCHCNPDGDTLGCAFSLRLAFLRLGAKADVVCGDKIPQKYATSCLKGEIFTQAEGSYEACIAVDCATEALMGAPYAYFAKHKNTFLIDHHLSSERYAKYNYVDSDAAACAIIVFNLIKEMKVEIDAELANVLYLGICTDTGNFSHSNVDYRALNAAAELVSLGAKPDEIYTSMFKNQSKERAMYYLDTMSKMKFYHDDKLAIIFIDDDQLKLNGLDKGDTEGFIDFTLTIASVEVGVSVYKIADKRFKLSFRSKSVDVNKIAATFGGGGHARASGAVLNGFYEDVVDKIVFTVGNYL